MSDTEPLESQTLNLQIGTEVTSDKFSKPVGSLRTISGLGPEGVRWDLPGSNTANGENQFMVVTLDKNPIVGTDGQPVSQEKATTDILNRLQNGEKVEFTSEIRRLGLGEQPQYKDPTAGIFKKVKELAINLPDSKRISSPSNDENVIYDLGIKGENDTRLHFIKITHKIPLKEGELPNEQRSFETQSLVWINPEEADRISDEGEIQEIAESGHHGIKNLTKTTMNISFDALIQAKGAGNETYKGEYQTFTIPVPESSPLSENTYNILHQINEGKNVHFISNPYGPAAKEGWGVNQKPNVNSVNAIAKAFYSKADEWQTGVIETGIISEDSKELVLGKRTIINPDKTKSDEVYAAFLSKEQRAKLELSGEDFDKVIKNETEEPSLPDGQEPLSKRLEGVGDFPQNLAFSKEPDKNKYGQPVWKEEKDELLEKTTLVQKAEQLAESILPKAVMEAMENSLDKIKSGGIAYAMVNLNHELLNNHEMKSVFEGLPPELRSVIEDAINKIQAINITPDQAIAAGGLCAIGFFGGAIINIPMRTNFLHKIGFVAGLTVGVSFGNSIMDKIRVSLH